MTCLLGSCYFFVSSILPMCFLIRYHSPSDVRRVFLYSFDRRGERGLLGRAGEMYQIRIRLNSVLL